MLYAVVRGVFRSHKTAPQALADMMVEMATKSRRQGILSLESDLEALPPGLFAVGKAIDGSTPEQLREAENELQITVERNAQSEGCFRVTRGVFSSFWYDRHISRASENVLHPRMIPKHSVQHWL